MDQLAVGWKLWGSKMSKVYSSCEMKGILLETCQKEKHIRKGCGDRKQEKKQIFIFKKNLQRSGPLGINELGFLIRF